MSDVEAIAAALTALEQALDGFAPPADLHEEALEAVSLAPPGPIQPAAAFEGVEDALDPAIAALGEALGEL